MPPIPDSEKLNALRAVKERFYGDLDRLAENLYGGRITLGMWEEDMRTRLRIFLVNAGVIGKGDYEQMTPSDWGRIGQHLRQQYRWLHGFSQDIYDRRRTITLAAIKARAHLYAEAAGRIATDLQAGDLRSQLSRLPGDGSTSCLCIVSPESRVLTSVGWMPIISVRPGMYVLTHLGRWRRVLASIVKPSLPYHRLAHISAPTGTHIACTTNHLWFTSEGWLSSIDIHSKCAKMSHLSLSIIRRLAHDGTTLCDLWNSVGESQQARQMYSMSVPLSLRESEGSSCEGMRQLLSQAHKRSRRETVGYDAWKNVEVDNRIRQRSTYHSQGFDGSAGGCLADSQRWEALDLPLDWRRQAYNLPLSSSVGEGARGYTKGVRNTSQRLRSNQRRFGEFGVHSCTAAQEVARKAVARSTAAVDLRDVWGDLSQSFTFRSPQQILFAGMLPPSTPLYDLAVEEDHSFVIEGLVAHNSRCACKWTVTGSEEDRELGVKAVTYTWILNPVAEHCEPRGELDGCIDLAGNMEIVTVSIDTEVPQFIGLGG